MFYNDPKTANLVISVSIAEDYSQSEQRTYKLFYLIQIEQKEQREYNNFVSEGSISQVFCFIRQQRATYYKTNLLCYTIYSDELRVYNLI